MLFYYGILFFWIHYNFSCFIMYYFILFCLWITIIFYCFKELVIMFRDDYFICCIFICLCPRFMAFCILFLFFFSSIIFSIFLEFSIDDLIFFCPLDMNSILSLYLFIVLFCVGFMRPISSFAVSLITFELFFNFLSV